MKFLKIFKKIELEKIKCLNKFLDRNIVHVIERKKTTQNHPKW